MALRITNGAKSTESIQDPVSRDKLIPSATQEVVRLDLSPKTESASGRQLSAISLQEVSEQSVPLSAMIEISFGRATIHIANGTEPAMLDRILSIVKGSVC